MHDQEDQRILSNNGVLPPIILLVEYDKNLALGLIYNLDIEGYRVLWVENGKKALDVFQERKIDLVIPDIMLPYDNGLEILERIRSSSPAMPVLILSAKSEPQDRIKGLTLGADDYLSKPFHLKELLLKIKGMLKRSNWYRESISNIRQFSFCHFHIDVDNFVMKLRKDFEENPSHPVYFKNIRTKGYIFRSQGEKDEQTDGES